MNEENEEKEEEKTAPKIRLNEVFPFQPNGDLEPLSLKSGDRFEYNKQRAVLGTKRGER